ncbi:MAG: PAS domain-containing protein [Thermoleophilia bacterium]
MLLLAARGGTRSAALAGMVVTLVAVQATASGHAFWDALDVAPGTAMLYMQAVLALVVIACLMIAAEANERAIALLAVARDATRRSELQRAAVRLERLRALAEQLADAATPAEVGHAILAQALRHTRASSGELLLASAHGDGLDLIASHGPPDRAPRWLQAVPLDPRFLVAAAYLEDRAIAVGTRAELTRAHPATAGVLGPGAQAAVAVPLRAFGRPVGAFAIVFASERALSADDLALLESMALLGGQVVERARAYESERRARSHADLLRRNAGALAEAQTRSDAAEATLGMLEEAGFRQSGMSTRRGAELRLIARGDGDARASLDALEPEADGAGEGTAPGLARSAIRSQDGDVLGILAARSDAAADGHELAGLLDAAAEQLGLALGRIDASGRYRELAHVVDATSDLVALLDDELRVRFLNAAGRRLLGLDDDAVSAAPALVDLVAPDDRPFALDQVVPAVRRSGHADAEIRLGSPMSERDVWTSLAVFPLADGLGQPAGYGAVARDVSEKRRAEADIRESHRFISEFTALVPGVLYVFDLVERRTVYVNRQTGLALGYSPDEIRALGDRFLPETLHPDDAPALERHFAELTALGEGDVAERAYRLRHRDGSWRWFLSRDAVFRRGADGRAEQLIGVATDITERRRARRRSPSRRCCSTRSSRP